MHFLLKMLKMIYNHSVIYNYAHYIFLKKKKNKNKKLYIIFHDIHVHDHFYQICPVPKFISIKGTLKYAHTRTQTHTRHYKYECVISGKAVLALKNGLFSLHKWRRWLTRTSCWPEMIFSLCEIMKSNEATSSRLILAVKEILAVVAAEKGSRQRRLAWVCFNTYFSVHSSLIAFTKTVVPFFFCCFLEPHI